MRTIIRIKFLLGVIASTLIFFSTNTFAQSGEWKTETTKDKLVTVKSRVSKRASEDGKTTSQLIEFVATTTANVDIQSLIALLKNVGKHREFNDDSESELIKKVSENEWIIYYYSDVPWPVSDFDAVYKMIISEDKETATFTLTAAPTLYQKTKVDRLEYSNMKYEFKNLGDGNVKITLSTSTCPTTKVPNWLIRSNFPSGPADIFTKMIKLAKAENK